MVDWLKSFWYHDTIDAMQARMLREVWHRRSRLRLLKCEGDIDKELHRLVRIWSHASPYRYSVVPEPLWHSRYFPFDGRRQLWNPAKSCWENV